MLIGVDCGCLGIKDKRLKVGVYRLAKNLLLALSKIDKKNKYLLYSFNPIEKSLMRSFSSRMRNVVVTPTRGWMKLWLPIQLNKDKPDIFLALGQAVPADIPTMHKSYMIDFVYDLAFEKFPDMYPGSLAKLKKNSREAAEKSESIITISNSTKKDLINLYKIKSNKIKVSYPGGDERFSSKGKKYKSKKPYFLFVGALKRTKNIPGLIKGFNYFLENSNLDYNLCIVGGDKWFDSDIQKNAKNVKFLGFVTDEKLAFLYKGAVAFVSPSFYEGFGFPMLEAMALSCPVISSNVSSIPEVVGDAGILVNPNNYKEIGNALIEVSCNSRKRKSMIKKGLERSKQFSNIKFGKDVLSIINSYE